jgi:hypothetical protein
VYLPQSDASPITQSPLSAQGVNSPRQLDVLVDSLCIGALLAQAASNDVKQSQRILNSSSLVAGGASQALYIESERWLA